MLGPRVRSRENKKFDAQKISFTNNGAKNFCFIVCKRNFLNIKLFALAGSNLRAQRCLTCQIGREASLSTWLCCIQLFLSLKQTIWASKCLILDGNRSYRE